MAGALRAMDGVRGRHQLVFRGPAAMLSIVAAIARFTFCLSSPAHAQ